jgi:ceramide glucosyltransferase
LLGSVLTQDVVTGGSVAAAALAVRLALMHAVDAQIGARTASRWLLPLRDCLTLAVFVASLCVRTVEWRGRQHAILPAGRIGPDTEFVA